MNTEIAEIKETLEEETLRKRMAFQLFVMKKLLGEDVSDEEALAWASTIGKAVSKVIDEEHNEEIRSLVMEESYEKAAEKIIPLLNN